MALEKYLECAKIVGTHGVRGMVRAECYCNTPAALAKLKRVYIKEKSGEYRLALKLLSKGGAAARLDNKTDFSNGYNILHEFSIK